MTNAGRITFTAAVALLGVALVRARPEGPRDAPGTREDPRAPTAGLARPSDLVFVENLGQWDTDACFVAHAGSATIALKDDAIDLIETRPEGGFLVRLGFDGARRPRLVGEARVATRYSYFVGNDPGRWRSCVPAYRSILYHALYEGVDLRVRAGGREGLVAYDLLLEPGADLEGIRLEAQGADSCTIDGEGRLVIRVGEREVRQSPPRAWEVLADGTQCAIESAFTLLDACRYGFVVPDRDPTAALVVDPGLEWSTFLGGAEIASEGAFAVAISEDGAVTVAGGTGAPSFPATPGAFDTSFNGGTGTFASDAFVARLGPSGQDLVFATFLGGSNNDLVSAISLAGDSICLVGCTPSDDFPVTPDAFDTSFDDQEAFITLLDATGATLQYSTYLGGSGAEDAKGGALDENGVVTVAGITAFSDDFPTTPDALSARPLGGGDVFIARIDTSTSTLTYGTYLGGSAADDTNDAFVLGDLVAITGRTSSTDLMVTSNAFDTTKNLFADAFVMVVDLSLNELVYSTYLGSSYIEAGRAVTLDEGGIVTVAGEKSFNTNGPNDFPITPGAFQTLEVAPFTCFITRMDTADGSLLYSTFLGGNLCNNPTDVLTQSSGAVTVVGHTSADSFPITLGSLKPLDLGNDNAFVTRFQPDGSGLAYSTYLGGTASEAAFVTLALDSSGAVVVAGDTASADFPTTPDVFQPESAGSGEVFVAKLDLLPKNVKRRGTSTPGCAGPLAIGVWNAPHPGAADFAIDCTDAPPLTTRGFLLISQAAAPGPLTIQGVRLFVDPTQLVALLPVTSDAQGHAVVPLRIPADVGGFGVHAQFLWSDPCAPGGWSVTPALEIAVPVP